MEPASSRQSKFEAGKASIEAPDAFVRDPLADGGGLCLGCRADLSQDGLFRC